MLKIEGASRLSGAVPYLNKSILPAGRQPAPVWREIEGSYGKAMSARQLIEERFCLRVPNPYIAVIPACCEALAVSCEGQSPDGLFVFCLLRRCGQEACFFDGCFIH
jgi:hypothetical protein